MKTSQHLDSISSGEQADAGAYQCTSCGHVLQLDTECELPTCPKDEGLHANHAWQPLATMDEADPTLPNSPNKPR